jgi:methylenetetrahydrofolate reductase (NADPH)
MSIQELPMRCPCCGYKTLSVRGGFQICEVCFWEDDGQDDDDADDVRGGPNGDLSLTLGRANYLEFGASRLQDLRHVRLPRPDEI